MALKNSTDRGALERLLLSRLPQCALLAAVQLALIPALVRLLPLSTPPWV